MTYWKEGDFDSRMGITGTFRNECSFHPGVGMIVKHCNVQAFSLRQDDNWDSRAVDVVFTCPECGYIDVFGVAISLEHYDKIQARLEEDSKKGMYNIEKTDIRVSTDSRKDNSLGV